MTKFLLICTILTTIFARSTFAHEGHGDRPKDGLLDSFKDKILTEGANSVFDWVFGDPDDAAMHAHEIEEHFAYLKDGDSNSLSSLASAAGIKPEFLSFKAHDYDNNDKIDGLELMALILTEKVGGHQQDALSPEATAQQMQLGSQIIDRLLDEEDLNRDGFLDFNEYSNARARLAEKH